MAPEKEKNVRPQIHRWTAPGLGSVNTYWIETESAVLVIDGQRELSKARLVRADIERTGKPIVAAFLTHPHPDHFGGIGVLAPPGSGVPLYGSRQTRESIAEDRFGLVKASHEVVKDDFPAQVTLPDQLLEDGQELTVAGLRIQVRELGEGEAECTTALYLPEWRALFCGDVIQDRMTAFLLEGRSQAWLEQLHRLAALFPGVERLYPGHGEPGTRDELVERQAEYLRRFRGLVQSELRNGSLAEGAEARIVTAMRERYPGYVPVAAIPDLLDKDVSSLARELGAGGSKDGGRE